MLNLLSQVVPAPPVQPAGMCHDPFNFPELAWQQSAADGYYRATVTIAPASYTNRYGTTVTRALNGLIPGPIMRMKVSRVACLGHFASQLCYRIPTGGT